MKKSGPPPLRYIRLLPARAGDTEIKPELGAVTW